MDTCTWKILDNETNMWGTSCAHKHLMGNHRTPIENGFKVCPYCSNELAQNTAGYIPNYDHYNGQHRRLADKYGT